MIEIYLEPASSDVTAWLVPTLAGLVGALIGGAASLLATRSANSHAVKLLRLARREESADVVLAGLWRAINTKAEERMGRDRKGNPTGEVVIVEPDFDRRALLGNVYDLGNRCAGDEPLVETLCHDFAWKVGYVCEWEVFRAYSAALSAALTRWRKHPKAFRQEAHSLEDHLALMPEAMALRDAAKAQGGGNPSVSDTPQKRRAGE